MLSVQDPNPEGDCCGAQQLFLPQLPAVAEEIQGASFAKRFTRANETMSAQSER